MSEDDSILLRHVDDVVDASPDKYHRHRAIGDMANPRNQHIEMPQLSDFTMSALAAVWLGLRGG